MNNPSAYNLIEEVLSLKMINSLVSDKNTSLQSFTNAHDLYIFCFFSNIKNFHLTNYESHLRFKTQETPFDLFGGTVYLNNSSTEYIVSINYKYEPTELKDENGQPYIYHYIQTESDTKRSGRSQDLNFNDYRYHSFHSLLDTNFNANHKHIGQILLPHLQKLNISNMVIFNEGVGLQRNNLKNIERLRFFQKPMKASLEDRNAILLEQIETSAPHLLIFINEYILNQEMPHIDSKISKPRKF